MVPHPLLDLHLFIICYLQRCIKFRGLCLQQENETGSQTILSSHILNVSHTQPSLDLSLYLFNFSLNFIQYFCMSGTEERLSISIQTYFVGSAQRVKMFESL